MSFSFKSRYRRCLCSATTSAKAMAPMGGVCGGWEGVEHHYGGGGGGVGQAIRGGGWTLPYRVGVASNGLGDLTSTCDLYITHEELL